MKRLRELAPSLELFYGRIAPLVGTPKLGPVLWQLPPTFRRDDERLARALELLPPGRHAFEFRHPSWFAPGGLALPAIRVALVIGDRPEVHSFQTHELTELGARALPLRLTRARSNYSELSCASGRRGSGLGRWKSASSTSTTTGRGSRLGTRCASAGYSARTA